MTAASEESGDKCLVTLSGRITVDSSPDLRVFLMQRLEPDGCRRMVVDFNDVAYVDTSGLAVLVEVLKAARTQGKSLTLSRLRERPRYLLESSRLLHLFDEPAADSASGPPS
jgi:anti-anti-sigma factor